MKTKIYEVQENTLCDGWINNWHEYDEENNQIPSTFKSIKEAQYELDSYLWDIEKAFIRGDIESAEDPVNFRIVEVKNEA